MVGYFIFLHNFMGAKEGRHLRKLTTIPEPGQTSIKISFPRKKIIHCNGKVDNELAHISWG